MLWLCLHLPDLAVDALQRGGGEDAPIAVSDMRGRHRLIVAADRAARALGVRSGMPADAALALVPTLVVKPRRAPMERQALSSLAAWAGQFSDRISLAPPQQILLEAGGSLRLFGGAQPLLDRVRDGTIALGYSARTALAPTPLAAALLARSDHGAVIRDREQITPTLGALALARLDLDEATCAALSSAGVRTLADCLALPRAALGRRFGPGCLDYLDRLIGRAPDPRPPFRTPPRFAGRLELPAEAVHTEALLFAIRRLLLELRGAARALDAGVQALRLTLEHACAEPTRLRIGLAAPGRDVDHFTTLIRAHLERLALPAPVRAIALASTRFVPLSDPQRELLPDSGHQQADWHRLLETLAARLGNGAVTGLASVDEHRPHKAWRECPPDTAAETIPATSAPRPLWLLPEPRPVAADALRLLAGPERIENGWWDGGDLRRDYFLAQARDGARLWIFRTFGSNPGWFVHGIFA